MKQFSHVWLRRRDRNGRGTSMSFGGIQQFCHLGNGKGALELYKRIFSAMRMRTGSAMMIDVDVQVQKLDPEATVRGT